MLMACNNYMLSVGIKEEFEQHVHNADLGPYISDKCNQHHTLTESFAKGFKFHPRESRVSFKMYANAMHAVTWYEMHENENNTRRQGPKPEK